jgi:hypothetical protein
MKFKVVKHLRRLILSEKAQITLQAMGVDFSDIEHFASLRDAYIRQRDSSAINRITTYELERLLASNALTLATGVNQSSPAIKVRQ